MLVLILIVIAITLYFALVLQLYNVARALFKHYFCSASFVISSDEGAFVHVAVTREDIESALRSEALYCPIANALRRIINHDYIVYVTQRKILLRSIHAVAPPFAATFELPEIARERVLAFDAEAHIDEFEFEFFVPDILRAKILR